MNKHDVKAGFPLDPQSLNWPKMASWDETRRIRDLYDLFVEDVKDHALFLLDPEGNIISWNAGAQRLLGYSESEIIGLPHAMLFTDEDRIRGVPDIQLKKAAAEGRCEFQHWIVRKDSTLFWGQCSSTALYNDTGALRGFGIVKQDATRRKLSEERHTLQYSVSHVLVGTSSPAETYARILRTIGEGLGWDFGALWRVDRHKQVLRCHALWSSDEADLADFPDATKAFTFSRDVGVPGRVWSAGEPLWLPDVQRDTNFPRVHSAIRAGLHSIFAFPVRSETAILGVIEFLSHNAHPQDDDLLRTAATLGNQIGLFLELLESEEATRKSEANKAIIVEASLDAIITMNHEGRITDFNPAAERIFGYSRFEAIGQEFAQLLISPSLSWQYRAELKRYLETGIWRLLGRRVEIPAMHSDGTTIPVELTMTSAPTDGQPIFVGYLREIVERRTAETGQGSAVGQSQAWASYLAFQNRIAQIVRAPLNHHDMEAEITAALGEELHADYCFFAPYDFTKDATIIDRDWRRDGLPSLAGAYRLSSSTVDFDARYGFFKTDIIADERSKLVATEIAAILDLMPIQAAIAEPLIDKGRSVGALVVAMAEEERTWTPEEVALVQEVSAQTFPVLESARQLKREHHIAVSLQQALLPAIPEELAGLDLAYYYSPALDEAGVGGDFWDAFAVKQGCYALILGDVSGKGLAAASQISAIRNMLRCLLVTETKLEFAATQLNKVLAELGMLTGFATLFAGVYDTGNRTLTYVSCGHEPAILLHANGGITALMPTGIAIGVLDDSEYAADVVPLAPGDALLLYTDGISEAGPDRTRFLGMSGLIEIVRACGKLENAESFVRWIVKHAAEYAQFGFADDVCVLAAIVRECS